LNALIEAGPRLPAYLRERARLLESRSAEIAEDLSDFLRAPVEVSDVGVTRRQSRFHEEGENVVFDGYRLRGRPTLRLTFDKVAATVAAEQIFAAKIDEPAVTAAIAQSLASRVACNMLGIAREEAAMLNLVRAEPGPLTDKPVVAATYCFRLPNKDVIAVTAELARGLTDEDSPPVPRLSEAVIDGAVFPAVAVLAVRKTAIMDLAKLSPGDVLQLPKASLEAITLQARHRRGTMPLATGVLGSENGVRSLSVTSTVLGHAEPAPAETLRQFG
jgi:hypothetical protein